MSPVTTKLLSTLASVIAITLLASCDTNSALDYGKNAGSNAPDSGVDSSTTADSGSPNDHQGNIIQPGEPIWTPHYELPANWHINLDNSAYARQTDTPKVEGDDWPTDLSIAFAADSSGKGQIMSPEELRDQDYDNVFCDSQIEDPFIDCNKGFQKLTLQLGSDQAQVLRYYGTWKSKAREVNEIYLNHDGKTLNLTAEGDFEQAKPAIVKMLSTLKWKQEQLDPNRPTLEPEEKGL